jgi:hypothetical protein
VADDSFELYDLRVEVVAPEGATLYCGAKPGDYFELTGEMVHLPRGSGILDLFARCALAAPPCEATGHSSERLDVHRRRGRLPGPQLSKQASDQPDGETRVSPRGGDGGPFAQ